MIGDFKNLQAIPKVILHIGSQKTGTSSTQRFLNNKRAELLETGHYYPVAGQYDVGGLAPGQHKFARKLMEWRAGENKDLLEVLHQIDQEIPVDQTDCLILSAEDLFQMHPPEILQDLFREKELSIHVTLRPQHEMLSAMYYTAVTYRRDVRAPEEFADFLLPESDYFAILDRWRAAFPHAKFNVRLFERHRSPRMNPVKDFVVVNQLGINVTDEDNIHEHASLTARPTMLMRFINGMGFSDENYYKYFNQLHHLGKELGRIKALYSPEYRMDVHEEFRDSNMRARLEFYDGIKGDLFAEPDLESMEEWSSEMGDIDQAVRDCMLIIVKKAVSG